MIDIDLYDLDETENIEWTPIFDTEYKINRDRLVVDCDTDLLGHVWVRLNDVLFCVCALERSVKDSSLFFGKCSGDKTCCWECGTLWVMYPEHNGRCWDCIFKEQLVGLVDKCTRIVGICKQSRSCLRCYSNSFRSNEKSLFWSDKNQTDSCMIALHSSKKFFFDCNICLHSFDTQLSHISNNKQWCKFCVSQEICKEVGCDICFKKIISLEL